jgi:hypothetical protein
MPMAFFGQIELIIHTEPASRIISFTIFDIRRGERFARAIGERRFLTTGRGR